ncbi:hypothetical protein TRFO_02598 [Tritrichomonas foetus]|uniref:Elongator complex protein 2 n=1 Tax=Tritrichomonas foetus TaxID=1144522 RepID=A0A1J4L6H2_9EUKA|nr:hypothetical protein TRFO_02598 [Tritrichomonas foetus]|eukprot:OHT17541.1 hypothetical protein TRFO_02598 [Tritrichomonas foetus]
MFLSLFYLMQAFGGCNADPDAWDVYNDHLAYGSGPCVIIQNLSTYKTVAYAALNYGIITCVKYDSNGFLIVGTCHGNLMILDPATVQVSSVLTFNSSITHLAIYENDILLSTATHGLNHLIRTADGLHLEKSFYSDLRCVALNLIRFNNVLIFGLGHPDGTVQLFVPSTGSSVTLEGYAWSLSLKFCKVSDDSILFASGSQERTIRLWRISLEAASEISKLHVSVTSHATLETDSTPFHVELFANLEGHSDWVNCISFSSSSTLCSASFDGQVLIWSAQEGSDYDISIRLGTTAVADDQSGFIGCKLLAPNDVMALSRNGGFSRWIDGKTVRCFAGHYDGVTGLTWTSIGCFLSVGLDNTARIFGIDRSSTAINGDTTYRELARPLIHGHAVFDCAQIADDLYAFAADEKNVRILQPSQCFVHIYPHEKLVSKHLPFASMVHPLSLDNAIIKDAESVEATFAPITASDFMKDRTPDAHEMWLTRWPEYKSIFGHERELRQMTVAENGDWFATGDDRGGYVVYDKNKLEKRARYVRDDSRTITTAISASPDSTMLLLVLENGIVKLIDPVTASILKTINADKQAYSCGWSRNSQYFIIGGENGISIYEREGEFAAHYDAGFVTAIEFIDEYTFIIGTNSGELIQLVYTPAERAFKETHRYQRHADRVTDIKANRQTNQILSGSNDHTILLQNTVI